LEPAPEVDADDQDSPYLTVFTPDEENE